MLCGGAGRFALEEVDVEGVEPGAGALKTFGRFSGFAFKGFALSFRPTTGAAVVVAARGLAENDKTTFSAPSSLFRPSSTGGGDPEEPDPEATCSSSSAFARSICSAISKRSRCSSDIVERSFFSAASCNRMNGQHTVAELVSAPRSLTCFSKAFGVLSIQARNQPFSVSSTRATPVLPRCFTNSVNVTHRVEFICW